MASRRSASIAGVSSPEAISRSASRDRPQLIAGLLAGTRHALRGAAEVVDLGGLTGSKI